MATLTNLLDDLRDRLNDASDTKFSLTAKTRWINRGQAAMFPKVHRIVRDSTIALVADTYEYTVPSALNEGILLGVELETSDLTSRFVQLDGRMFDIVPGGTSTSILVLKGASLPSVATANVRITAAMPLTELSAGSDTYTGPARTQELPVIYAMSVAMSRDIEARMQYQRFNATQALNGVVLGDFMESSQFWMSHFFALLEALQMPVPAP